jgi:hypothetical protein
MFHIVKRKPNYGAIGVNRKKKHDNSPDYTGNINVEGIVYNVSMWENKGDKGDKTFNLLIGRHQ